MRCFLQVFGKILDQIKATGVAAGSNFKAHFTNCFILHLTTGGIMIYICPLPDEATVQI